MGAEAPEEAEVSWHGLAGDRREWPFSQRLTGNGRPAPRYEKNH
jgi:hypothetical protein